jgi:hypothetical protein
VNFTVADFYNHKSLFDVLEVASMGGQAVALRIQQNFTATF